MPRKPSRKPELAPPPSAAETLVGATSQSSQTSTQSSQSTLVAPTPSAGVVSRKRPGVQPLQNSQSNKRPRHASTEEDYGVVPACARRSGMVRETADLVLPGELDTTISDPTGTETVPVRYLDAFAVFDPRTGELLDLSEVEKENAYQFEAAGYTWPVVVDDDDDDEEEDDDDDEQEEDSGADTDNDNGPSASQPGEGMMPARPYVHLSAIMTVWFHPQPGPDGDSRIWIQTSFAWYILRAPSLEYTSMYLSFLIPRRITQLVLAHTGLSREVFTEEYLTKAKEYGHCFSEADLAAAVPLIKEEAPEIDAGLLSTPLVAELVGRRPSRSKSRTPRGPRARRASRAQPPQQRKRSGGANLETRARDAQSTSQVLPRVARLARRHVVGSLTILGTPGSADDASRVCTLGVEDQTHTCNDAACPVFAARKEHGIVIRALERFHDRRSTKASTEIDARTVRIHDKTYSIGDTVLLPRAEGKDMPTRASLGVQLIVPEDCFHLAQILFFDAGKGRAHVRLYVAARETVLDELAGPREVMLTDECASVRTRDICGSLPIVADGRDAKPGERRLRYAYCQKSGAFTDVGPENFCGQPKGKDVGSCSATTSYTERSLGQHTSVKSTVYNLRQRRSGAYIERAIFRPRPAMRA
ncbi:hypothetical protein BD626DRAFT_226404 [Schizophyllum amplum]|uniref:RFTS domain-containing protein n=1 Tax=Schizophyllum amplum TaxID=97359 RepID=A0A550BWQ7_9AGAR|nr:hypothetical protein BD626DRAFT_226404 [Auriculariopsis ampla]